MAKLDLKNLPIEAQDPEIKDSDFTLLKEVKIHEQKFQTKPTTFFKDSIKRFSKNKSSVVAAGILGGLLLLSFVIPIVDRNDTTGSHPEFYYLTPKLFNSGTGFWDGTKKYKNIPVEIQNDDIEGTNKEENWWPNPISFPSKSAISNRTFTDLEYSNYKTIYGKEGYVQFGYYNNIDDEKEAVYYFTRSIDTTSTKYDLDAENLVVAFDTYNEDKLAEIETQNTLPENYTLADVSLVFKFTNIHGDTDEVTLIATSEKGVHSIGSLCEEKEDAVDVNPIIKEYIESNNLASMSTDIATIRNPYFAIKLENQLNHENTCALIRSVGFKTNSTNKKFKELFEAPSFGKYSGGTFEIESASQNIVQDDVREVYNEAKEKYEKVNNTAFWATSGTKNVYMSRVAFCSFVYDSYEAVFGVKYTASFEYVDVLKYQRNGWLDIDFDVATEGGKQVIKNFYYNLIDPENCPIVSEITADDLVLSAQGDPLFVKCSVSYYKYYGYTKMPKFLLGTDKSGKDMLKFVFEGLRTSLLLGLLTSAVCFIFGLIWGSVSGYFGGAVDLIMERLTDILSGIPWIVVMTLVIIKAGKTNFWILALALCMTGWIGTAYTTRTQFYRFRGREYVLASRTLGASDARLIAKHILPNAMGTIITSAVLMIPSVIFSEATISYLGLGLKGLSSLGVILSDNQRELLTNPYLLIFPSVVVALLMISFNLFGNGLRDAVNPSLKGEGE